MEKKEKYIERPVGIFNGKLLVEKRRLRNNEKIIKLSLDPVHASWTGITKEQVKQQLESWGEWEELNLINQGNATNKLLKIISQETIATILRIYRVSKDLQKKQTFSKLSSKYVFPEKDINKIKSILEKLKAEGWLFKEDIEPVLSKIIKGIVASPKGRKALYAYRKETRKKEEKLRRPADEPLNFVIYFLAKHLQATTGRPQWSLICNFLIEQQIVIEKGDTFYAYPQVRDRYRKINENNIQKQYEYYRDLYLYPQKNIYDDGSLEGIKIVRTAYFKRDIILPIWSELLPDSEGKN